MLERLRYHLNMKWISRKQKGCYGSVNTSDRIFGKWKLRSFDSIGRSRTSGDVYVKDILAEQMKIIHAEAGGLDDDAWHCSAPTNCVGLTQEFLQGAGFAVLPWPSMLPYLYPIENVLGDIQCLHKFFPVFKPLLRTIGKIFLQNFQSRLDLQKWHFITVSTF